MQQSQLESAGPKCKRCGTPMWLAWIEPDKQAHDKRTFKCPVCDAVKTEPSCRSAREMIMSNTLIQDVWFDDAATSAMGEAFDQACKSLQEFGSSPEIIANLIIAAAKNGERDPVRLYEQALKAFEVVDVPPLSVSVARDVPVPIPASRLCVIAC